MSYNRGKKFNKENSTDKANELITRRNKTWTTIPEGTNMMFKDTFGNAFGYQFPPSEKVRFSTRVFIKNLNNGSYTALKRYKIEDVNDVVFERFFLEMVSKYNVRIERMCTSVFEVLHCDTQSEEMTELLRQEIVNNLETIRVIKVDGSHTRSQY